MDTTPIPRPPDMGADRPVRPPGMVGAAPTTMMVFGILLIVSGSLLVLAAMLSGSPAFCPSCPAGYQSPRAGILAVGLLALALGIVEFVVAVKIPSGNAKARQVGIVLALALGVIGLLSVIIAVASLATGGVLIPELVLGLFLLVPNVFVAYALVTRGHWFAYHAAAQAAAGSGWAHSGIGPGKVCSRCGKALSPYWTERCAHFGARFAEFAPQEANG